MNLVIAGFSSPHADDSSSPMKITKTSVGVALLAVVVGKFMLDMGIPFLIMNLYYMSPKSYLLSMGKEADGKKVVHIKYCVA